MVDVLTIYNLAVKYPNTVDFVREVEKMARAETIDEIIDIVAIACNFDDDNRAEMKKYILEQLKEQKNG